MNYLKHIELEVRKASRDVYVWHRYFVASLYDESEKQIKVILKKQRTSYLCLTL